MRAAIRPVRTPLRRFRPLLALFLLVAPGCGAPPPEIDLVGRVTSASGAPMSGVLVHAGDELTTAATDGSFEIRGVRVPYTLTVASTVGDPWVHAFAGLTTATPQVTTTQFEPPLLEATISGDAWGGVAVPPNRRVSVCAEGRDFVVWGCTFADGGDLTYDLRVAWSGATSAHVRVHALYLAVDGTDLPTGTTGVRQVDTLVTNGGSTDLDLSQNLLLVTGPTVPVTVDAGSGTIAGVVIAVRVGERLVQTVYAGPWSGGVVDVALPPAVVAEAVQVLAWGVFPSGTMTFAWGVEGVGTAVDLVVPPPPQQLEPAGGATGVAADTTFRALGGDAAARQFYWRPVGVTDGPRVRLTTPASTPTVARLPDVGVVGLTYPAGATYAWDVTDVFAPDYAAAVQVRIGFYEIYGVGGLGQAASGAFAASEDREFVLAP